MGERRQGQIDRAIESYTSKPRHAGHKITDEDAAEIKRRHDAGESTTELATEFGVSKWTVYAICQGRRSTG